MSDPLNCHFVSRFLTKPWEWGQRQLHYYDFDEKRIRWRSSESLSSQHQNNSPETDRRLNRVIETPLSRALPDLLDPSGPTTISEWDVYRALLLLLPLQAARFDPSDDLLEKTINRPDAELDAMAQASEQMFLLHLVRCPEGFRFFYPEAGLFSMPLAVRDSVTFVLAMPLSPTTAVVGIARSVASEVTLTPQVASHLAEASVGAGDASRRVVIHPDIVNETEASAIVTRIEALRASLTDLIQQAERVNALHRRAQEIAGLVKPGAR